VRVAAALAAALPLAGAGVEAKVSQDQAPPPAGAPPVQKTYKPIRWHRSIAVGLPWAGRLLHGVQLPPEGPDFFTWDPVLEHSPDRGWRRWGHDRLIRTLLRVLYEYRQANPEAPRVGVGDISRKHGGPFGKRYGGLGHGSHQDGLDVDVYYPRLDGLERRPVRVSQIDFFLAQELVDRLVRAGARYVFVGPNTDLFGPKRIVQPLIYHDEHMHVRLRPRRGGR
jgi:murein endopeptidase